MTEKYRNTPKGRIAPNGYRLCDPLPEGQILLDFEKTQWVIGKPIGLGGFGEIYLIHPKDTPSRQCVMKLDNINGPLFVEVNFVLRACQKTQISAFMESKKLSFLGVPRFIASGTHNSSYRFLIMERLGEELQKVLETRHLSISTTCRIACRIIDVLEYIHDQGYIHADIKAQNILRSLKTTTENNDNSTNKRTKANKRQLIDDQQSSDNLIDEDDNYYLIDYGLVERFILQGSHKPYEPDKRKANNGTCEFRSRDAHIGVISRRSDIESLGYNLILWFYGRHPWANLLKDAEKVLAKKNWAMSNIDDFLREAFSGKTFVENSETNDSKTSKTASSKSKSNGKKTPAISVYHQPPVNNNLPISTTVPKGFRNFFAEINQLSHDDRPNYEKYKNILQDIARLNPKTANHNLFNNDTEQPEEVIHTSDVIRTKKSNIKNSQIQNGNSELPSIADDDESDDTEIEDNVIDNNRIKSSSTRTTRTQTSKQQKLSPTKQRIQQLKNKNKIQSPQTTPKSTINQRKNLRNRKSNNIFDDNDDENGDDNDESLISFTPFDSSDPLFGPFEPEESLNYVKNNNDTKRNRTKPLINGKIGNNIIVNDENETDNTNRNNNQCRIYINNRRCRSRQSFDDDDWNPNYKISVKNNNTTEQNNGPILKMANGKLSKSTVTISSSSSSKSTTKTTKTPSSKPNGISKRNVQKSTNCLSSKFSTPPTTTNNTNNSGVTETAAMQRIRLMLQNKKKK
ncbi:Serine/threonine-protein kinase vrk1 [Dermatophagoides pteronyssinus]|uniref:Serine/threonine-protein kinase vrk1 n=1 Tax=Dermatophagoides pteronyssinus TaxID=6956 RepID=A0ABQ8JPQ2_DERPT|nr:Serine/threonine-protein kinase vrk1 [Dermatophagoides pteronyssinus]